MPSQSISCPWNISSCNTRESINGSDTMMRLRSAAPQSFVVLTDADSQNGTSRLAITWLILFIIGVVVNVQIYE